MTTTARIAITTAFISALAAPALAQQSGGDHAGHGAPAVKADATLADGEVRKVDPETRRITIRHGPITSLGMPPMTMVFQVRDPALLDQVKSGDKIRFAAERERGAYVVTRIEPAK